MRNNYQSCKPSMFVHYCHAQSAFVDSIETAISRRITVVRDISEVDYGQSLKEFMSTIGEGDFVLLVISDESLKSVACMHEILILWKEFGSDSFWMKVIPFVVEKDRKDVFDPVASVKYVKHWKEQCDLLNERLKDVENCSAIGHQKVLQEMRDFSNMMSDFLCEISDRRMPESINLISYIKVHVAKSKPKTAKV